VHHYRSGKEGEIMNTEKQTCFIDLKSITITSSFWVPFMERVRTSVIPYQWETLNDRVPEAAPSYCMRNFKLAAQITHPELDYDIDRAAGHGGCVFQDSDMAKWIEAAAYSLSLHPDEEFEKTLDTTIDIICNAQQDDGYLNTYYIINGLENRFTNLKDNHELYCLGHFIEAASAYYEARGKRKLLDAVSRYVDCVDKHIGPEEGKIHGYPGHEIIEMALVRLYSITGDEKHLRLAVYFINERGREPLFFEEEEKRRGVTAASGADRYDRYKYYQAAIPVRDQCTAEGHAVRAVYLYSGMADVARLTGDSQLFKACEELFANIAGKQMYITGGIGQTCHGEAFTIDYDLPNDTVYAETCASIGLAFFAKRMAALSPKGMYADVLERTLYNGIISGMSLDGKAFFYVNPLEVFPESSLKDPGMKHIKIERQKWFGCACCPPNLARIIASLGNYIHSVNINSLYTHLYISGDAVFSMKNKTITINLETDYPREGRIDIRFKFNDNLTADTEIEFNYGFRIPFWCTSYTVELNGRKITPEQEDGYAIIRRSWRTGDRIMITFAMPVTIVEANSRLRHNAGKAAIMRGPVVYCLEEADNGTELCRILLGTPADFTVRYENLLGGLPVITCTGRKRKAWEVEELYRARKADEYEKVPLRFTPYYAWANRGRGEMIVWVNLGPDCGESLAP
jgi:DUF1680 family protein